MPEFLYRFRSADALIHKFRELENGEIFFSSTSELNDPMEGFTDVFWKGNETLWSNLLRHYVFCLTQTFYFGMILGDQFTIDLIDSSVRDTPLSLKGLPAEKVYNKVCETFLGRQGVRRIIGQLANRDGSVRRNELSTYLRLLHPIAIYYTMKEAGDLRAEHSHNKTAIDLTAFKEAADAADGLMAKLPDRADHTLEQGEIFFTYTEIAAQQMRVITHSQRRQDVPSPMWGQFIDTFPGDYISAVERMVYPNWHIASFTSNPDNASMWGVYGDAHRGFCLKFRTQKLPDGREGLPLRGVVGSSFGPEGHRVLRNLRSLAFSSVDYETAHPEIDFFRTFGRFTVKAMQDFWFSRADGSLDPIYNDVFGNEDAWRNRYWALFEGLVSIKLPEWAHEQEYRLVHASQLSIYPRGGVRRPVPGGAGRSATRACAA
ncbi:DUF2971 domain-containing protein [Lichenibacterium dinghuense]|uniref:DUF2971 domain-containing protein n=1 Tax=Lichenibacterium dinghuense TaxID=2895977 RepID=UPI001F3ADE50|nr:DUF2971 domain-containing protein [Lichenibacterium sp. 6Y81]